MKKSGLINLGILLLVGLVSMPLLANDPRLPCEYRTTNTHQKDYKLDEFVILYDLSGKHGLKHPDDLNQNQVPDVIEDIALQLVTMRDLLTRLNFRHPLSSPRYQARQVSRILVRVRHLADKRGLAYDEPHYERVSGQCVLMIDIAPSIATGNLTPAHELFHLYQYGYTLFKRPWFLEGTARWAEDLVGVRHYPQDDIPQGQALNHFFASDYQAVGVWMTLLKKNSVVDRTVFSDDLMMRRYSNGQAVIEDRQFIGADKMLSLLQAFSVLDQNISQVQGLSFYFWPEEYQRDKIHDQEVWSAILALYSAADYH